MPSRVDIANYALGQVGGQSITNFDDDSREARAVKLLYDSVRDAVLRSHPWNFAVKRATLARLTETPPFTWSYYYQLPDDYLRLLEFNPETRDPYKIEGRRIATNAGEAKIVYVARVTDETQFDPLFVQAFATRLAIELAQTLGNVQGAGLLSQLWEAYRLKIAEARSVDAMENPPEVLDFDYFTDARSGDWRYRPIKFY